MADTYEVLLYFYHNTDIDRPINISSDTYGEILYQLLDLGYVSFVRQFKFPCIHSVRITYKGKQEAEKILKEQEPKESTNTNNINVSGNNNTLGNINQSVNLDSTLNANPTATNPPNKADNTTNTIASKIVNFTTKLFSDTTSKIIVSLIGTTIAAFFYYALQ